MTARTVYYIFAHTMHNCIRRHTEVFSRGRFTACRPLIIPVFEAVSCLYGAIQKMSRSQEETKLQVCTAVLLVLHGPELSRND